jgi:hypothetical protein
MCSAAKKMSIPGTSKTAAAPACALWRTMSSVCLRPSRVGNTAATASRPSISPQVPTRLDEEVRLVENMNCQQPQQEYPDLPTTALVLSQDEESELLKVADRPNEVRWKELTDSLLWHRKKTRLSRLEGNKRQAIFIAANCVLLLLTIIALSAEVRARVPMWVKMMVDHLRTVQKCSKNQEAMLECASRGDFTGWTTAVLLSLSRSSVIVKRIFLFGLDSPTHLLAVVYESFVRSIFWGISYLFIRRGMNSDTRPQFIQKYWKDAVYGSLAGFNATFMKLVMKNLVPAEFVEGALLGWLTRFENEWM